MWEDMFFQLAANGYFFDHEIDFPASVKEKLPPDVSPVYWDYFSEDPAACEAMVLSSKKLSDKVWFAGGAWVWAGFSPHLRFSNERNAVALEKCVEHGIRNAMITLWADHGGECPFYAALPTLMHAAGTAQGWALTQIKRRFREITGESYDEEALFEPEISIKYGAFFLGLLLDEFEDTKTALAAYHAGRGQVNKWLVNPEYSADSKKLDNIPFEDTSAYAEKVMKVKYLYVKIYKMEG
jgi:hypothetical protein